MKHLKILGLLAVTASVLTAFAATASADVLTSPTGTTFTGTIKAKSEGHVVHHNPVGKIECESAFDAIVSAHGASTTVKLNTGGFTFTNCTNDWHVTVVTPGSFSIHGVTGGYNGDVFSTGTTLEATNSKLGNVTCRYATNNTTVGTLTGGTPATLDISGSILFHSGSVFCGTGGTPWTGSYKVTSPSTLLIDTT